MHVLIRCIMDTAAALPQYLPALVWLLTCSALVLFMQAGFAALESGTVRAKNSINVALKNVIDMCCSFAGFFVVGFALMFGASQAGLVGKPTWFLAGLQSYEPSAGDVFTAYPIAMFLFQAAFCSTAATIVSGGVAERCRFMAYVLVSLGIGVVIYPVYGHWVWGGGWLAGLGFHDFAGGSVVHLLGAGITLVGIKLLGNRIGRFSEDGTPQPVAPSSMPMVAIGVMILAFGWIGFNGGSAPLGVDTPTIIVATLIAACFGGLAVMLVSWGLRGVPQADLILNGVLGGLVAITPCANIVGLPSAAIVGVVGGLAVMVGTHLMERWRLDDAVGAVPVHGFAGVAGLLCTALFADARWLAEVKQMDRWHLLGIQALGVVVCLAWSMVAGWLLWWLVGRITSLRIGRDEELVGMNYSEHQVADPLRDLTLTMAASLRGEHRLADLDNVRDGELIPLARTVRGLVSAMAGERQRRRDWAGMLEELREMLAESHHRGHGAASAATADIEETRRSLAAVLATLDQHRADHPSVVLVAEVVRGLDHRLAHTQQDLPRIAGSFERIKEVGGRIDRLVGDLGSGVRP
jgi:Amt family ammonium transporter